MIDPETRKKKQLFFLLRVRLLNHRGREGMDDG